MIVQGCNAYSKRPKISLLRRNLKKKSVVKGNTSRMSLHPVEREVRR